MLGVGRPRHGCQSGTLPLAFVTTARSTIQPNNSILTVTGNFYRFYSYNIDWGHLWARKDNR
jgi:hypothetical protein